MSGNGTLAQADFQGALQLAGQAPGKDLAEQNRQVSVMKSTVEEQGRARHERVGVRGGGGGDHVLGDGLGDWGGAHTSTSRVQVPEWDPCACP